MSTDAKEPKLVSRRFFIKGAAVGAAVAGAGAIAACAPTPTTAPTAAPAAATAAPTRAAAAAPAATQVPAAPAVQPVTGAVEPAYEPEESVIIPVGGNNSETAVVDVKNNKIIRIRPLHYDWKYTKDELAPARWKIQARGKTLEPRYQSLISYFAAGYKKRVYSPNRILYPLKRVDWEPGGDPAKINPQNRGKSKFKRISWDEAATIVASEIKRVQDKYGHLALFVCEQGPHQERKNVHKGGGWHRLLMAKTTGCTNMNRNADSWEGWYWGAAHVWGTGSNGEMTPNGNTLLNVSQNTQMLVWQGGDPETTAQEMGQFSSRALYWFTELGIKQVWITPDLNYSAAIHADKWIPILPNMDAPLQMAVIYTWLKEGTYDKAYVATHTVGFDKIQAYILGTEDGVPKTPEWAAPKCGVPEWTIKALAREWASKVTSPAHYQGGGLIRGPYSTESARWQCVQLGMQGVGKPGVCQCYEVFAVTPGRKPSLSVSKGYRGIGPANTPELKKSQKMEQFIGKVLTPHAILNPPQTWWGHTGFMPVEDQFLKFSYPIPKEQGGTEIHMMWSDKPCYSVCWNDGFMWLDAYRSPKLECIVEQHQWMEDDCYYADIVLPVDTQFEEEDIETSGREMTSTLYYQPAAIKHVGEAKSDYEIVLEVAKKLEKFGGAYADAYNKMTEGKTVQDWIKFAYENSGAKDLITWDKLLEKKYYISPINPDWASAVQGAKAFYDDPVKNPLVTPTGKMEFYSQRLADNFPDDNERGPMPRYVQGGPGWTHDETIFGERAKKYPLLLVSNHPRWRCHSQHDDMTWLREIPTCKVKGPDGYMYEPLWIHPADAAKRNIADGDIVKVLNERGITLGGAIVTQRIRPGAVYQDHGARIDLITDKVNRGGDNNVISPALGHSKNCWGLASTGFLVECEKLSGNEYEEWRKKYPEAFARDYDPAAGLKFSAWIEGGV